MTEILIHPAYVKTIASEFDCTAQTVRMALKYVFNSNMAIKIRERAIELLVEEAKKPVYSSELVNKGKDDKSGNTCLYPEMVGGDSRRSN